MTLYVIVVEGLARLAVLATVLAVVLFGMNLVPRGRAVLARRLGHRIPVAGAALVALVAMAGSLYFSDGVGFPPCLLCWYQRIAMYPLVAVLGVGWLLKEEGAWKVALPLPLVGLPIALYHVALQNRPTLDLVSCQDGVPCSARFFAVFGFISIPALAAAAFLLILALLITAGSVQRERRRTGEVPVAPPQP